MDILGTPPFHLLLAAILAIGAVIALFFGAVRALQTGADSELIVFSLRWRELCSVTDAHVLLALRSDLDDFTAKFPLSEEGRESADALRQKINHRIADLWFGTNRSA